MDEDKSKNKTVSVNEDTWLNIMKTKVEHGYKSMDNLIQYMWENTFDKKGEKKK